TFGPDDVNPAYDHIGEPPSDDYYETQGHVVFRDDKGRQPSIDYHKTVGTDAVDHATTPATPSKRSLFDPDTPLWRRGSPDKDTPDQLASTRLKPRNIDIAAAAVAGF